MLITAIIGNTFEANIPLFTKIFFAGILQLIIHVIGRLPNFQWTIVIQLLLSLTFLVMGFYRVAQSDNLQPSFISTYFLLQGISYFFVYIDTHEWQEEERQKESERNSQVAKRITEEERKRDSYEELNLNRNYIRPTTKGM